MSEATRDGMRPQGTHQYDLPRPPRESLGPPVEVVPGWVFDPNLPRAPTQEVWDRLTPEQRDRVVATLPSEFPVEMFPPEGEHHDGALHDARQTLWLHYGRKEDRRGLYIAGNMAVYYPGEVVCAPDVFAVRDVPLHKRDSWIVSAEGKGPELIVEVMWHGSRRKDLVQNVERYARLGVLEYFVFDLRAGMLHGWRLPDTGPPYAALRMEGGKFASEVLGLRLGVEGGALRFFAGEAVLPTPDEVRVRAQALVDELTVRVLEEARRAEEAERRAEEEARRREEAERRAEEAERRIEDLEAALRRLRASDED